MEVTIEKIKCCDCGNDFDLEITEYYLRTKYRPARCNGCADKKIAAEKKRLLDERESLKSEYAKNIDKDSNIILLEIGVPKRNLHCFLSNFKGDKSGKTPGLITGPTGTGKTHLAVGYLREKIKENFKRYDTGEYREINDRFFSDVLAIVIRECNFVSSLDFVWQMRKPDNSEEVMKKYCHSNFLIIDDFGAERPTEWALECLGKLIYTRHADMKETLLTSNLSLKDLAAAFNERIASRIAEFGPQVVLSGKDHRLGA